MRKLYISSVGKCAAHGKAWPLLYSFALMSNTGDIQFLVDMFLVGVSNVIASDAAACTGGPRASGDGDGGQRTLRVLHRESLRHDRGGHAGVSG